MIKLKDELVLRVVKAFNMPATFDYEFRTGKWVNGDGIDVYCVGDLLIATFVDEDGECYHNAYGLSIAFSDVEVIGRVHK